MSSPGYRNTAPVRLYMEFSREPLEDLDSGAFAGEDPFDLQNTLVGFDYSLTDSENAGSFVVTLINPSQVIEKKIFSWHCAINPRRWAAQQEATPEEWAASAASTATVYLRWGYDNDTVSKDSIVKKAYSHIHKTQLYDIDFNVSNDKDRVIRLYLLNNHDIGIQRQRSGSFGGRVKTYPVKIVNDSGVMKRPSRIISEMLAKVASSERGIKTFVKLSDEHKEILDDEFEKIHPGSNKQWPTPDEQDGTPPIERTDPEKTTSTKITLDVVKQYFEYLDLSVSLHPPGSPNFKPKTVPAVKPTPIQNNMTAGQMDPNAVNRLEEAAKVTDQTTFQFSGAYPGFVDSVANNPLSSLYADQGGPFVGVEKYILLNSSNGLDHNLESLKVILSKGQAQILHLPRGNEETFLNTFNADSDKSKYFAVDQNSETNTFTFNESYAIYDQLETRITSEEAKRQEIIENEAPSGTDQDIQADTDTFNALPDEVEKPEENLTDESTVYASCSNTFSFLNSFINLLNTTFFNATGEYVDIRYFQTSVIPKAEREGVSKKLGVDTNQIKWDSAETDTICVIGSLSYIQGILDFNREIKSFPIQSVKDPDRISIATGFNKRKDNIIVNLDHKVSKGSFYNTVLTSPIIPQKLYAVAKRFESDSYRELIYSQLQFVLRKQADVSESYYVEGNPFYNVSTEFTQLGTAAFPEALIQNAVSQVSRIVDGLDNETVDSALSESSKSKLFKNLSEDIAFIYNNDFMDVFFPEVAEDKLDDIRVINYVDGEEIKDKTSFRFISNAPLSVLQKQLGVDDPEQALAYAAKLRAMFAFKKTISNIRIRTLGVPEMDILAYETGVRKCAIWISEPRVPGTFHWLSGMYVITNVSHKLDVNGGYTSEFTLIPTAGDSAEEMIKHGYTFLKDV